MRPNDRLARCHDGISHLCGRSHWVFWSSYCDGILLVFNVQYAENDEVITVSTSLIPPGPAYQLEWGWREDGGSFTPTYTYLFAHPRYWTMKAVRADVGLDAGNPWGDGRENAKLAFYAHVADRVEWYSIPAFAKDLEQRQKRAERERLERASGHIELFC